MRRHWRHPMDRYEYMRIKADLVPEEFKQLYNLHDKIHNGYIYMEIRHGCYGLPQAGILANKLLKKRLAKHGYFELPHTPGLFKHISRPVQFTLVVDDCGGKQFATPAISNKRTLCNLCRPHRWFVLRHHTTMELQRTLTRHLNDRLRRKTINKIQASQTNKTTTLPMGTQSTKLQQQNTRLPPRRRQSPPR